MTDEPAWPPLLLDRINKLEERVSRLEQRHGIRRDVPVIPIPPDNTRSLEEILAVVEEIRAWTKRLRIE